MVQTNPRVMVDVHPHPVAFLQRKWVQNSLPLLASLAFHGGLIIFAYSVYRVATVIKYHVEAPTGEVYGDPITIEPQGLDKLLPIDKNFVMPQGNHNVLDEDSPIFKPNEPKVLNQTLGKIGSGDESTDVSTMIGTGRRPGPLGVGTLDGTGDQVGPRCNIKFGTPGGDPTATITGIPSRIPSPRVVFVCDATGSMQSVFGGLKQELQRCVNGLDIRQAYNVIFFSDDKVMSLYPDGLKFATTENRKKAESFLSDIAPHGQTNPLPAIRAAFAQKPELIYVLTDGFDQVDSLESVYNEFATLNKEGKTRVNTILIGSPDQKDLVDILKRIANDNRGTMRVVSRDAFE